MRRTLMFPAGRGSKGFVLVATAITVAVLLGMLGLATDLARMYVARNELQAFTDAACLAAALELNGTQNGITHATSRATSYPNRWNFETAAAQNVTVGFSSQPAGPYVANPADPKNVKYVQVSAQGGVVVYFMPGFSSFNTGAQQAGMLLLTISKQQTLRVTATSGQFLVSGFSEGLLPYSPDSIAPNDKANFGFKTNQMYTLRWPPPGQRTQKTNWCDGDEEANFVTPSAASQRGFIDIGEGSGGGGADFIRQAIVNNVQTHPLYINDVIVGAPGNKGTESDALRERFNQDSDTSSVTYQQYMDKINNPNFTGPKGNGRRFVVVPVNNPANDVVIGFAGFFLHRDVCSVGGDSLFGNGGNSASQGGGNVATCCAEYVGPAVVNGRKGGDDKAGAYRVRLFK